MDLYEYGRIITKAQGKLNKIMYEYHHNRITNEKADKLANMELAKFTDELHYYLKRRIKNDN